MWVNRDFDNRPHDRTEVDSVAIYVDESGMGVFNKGGKRLGYVIMCWDSAEDMQALLRKLGEACGSISLHSS